MIGENLIVRWAETDVPLSEVWAQHRKTIELLRELNMLTGYEYSVLRDASDLLYNKINWTN